MSPEVLIYIQTVKNYLKNNQEARDYFLRGVDEEIFYKYLAEISQKNFNNNGDVTLNITQFEILKRTVAALSIVNKSDEEINHTNLFFKVKDFGYFSLN
jgi:hypothetical protein